VVEGLRAACAAAGMGVRGDDTVDDDVEDAGDEAAARAATAATAATAGDVRVCSAWARTECSGPCTLGRFWFSLLASAAAATAASVAAAARSAFVGSRVSQPGHFFTRVDTLLRQAGHSSWSPVSPVCAGTSPPQLALFASHCTCR